MIIGELSARSGVSPRSLRYYESQGLVSSTRGDNGYRIYDEAAVPVVRAIRSMYELGFSSDTVRTLLPCVTGAPGVDRDAVVENVRLLHDGIVTRIADLEETRDELERFLDAPDRPVADRAPGKENEETPRRRDVRADRPRSARRAGPRPRRDDWSQRGL